MKRYRGETRKIKQTAKQIEWIVSTIVFVTVMFAALALALWLGDPTPVMMFPNGE